MIYIAKPKYNFVFNQFLIFVGHEELKASIYLISLNVYLYYIQIYYVFLWAFTFVESDPTSICFAVQCQIILHSGNGKYKEFRS